MKKNFIRIVSAVLTGVMLFSSTVAAAEVKTLTISEAVSKAFRNSNELKKINEDYYITLNSESKIKSNLSSAETDTAVVSAAISLLKNELSSSMAQYSEKDKKTSIELSLYKYFASVISAERELELYEKKLALDKKELDIQQVKCEMGLISQSAYDMAVHSYEKSVASLANKEQSISEAYRSLNSVMGTALDTRYQLEVDFELVPFSIPSLESYINDAIKNNSNVKETERSIEISEYEYNISTYSETVDKESAAMKLTQSKRSLTDEKESIRLTLQGYYDEIMSLERSHQAAVADYEAMQKQLEIKEVQLELGKITPIELEKYMYEMESAYNNIIDIEANHALKVMQFKNTQIL